MTSEPRTFALIPAAGQSTRMGQPKLSLPLGGRTVLEWVITAFQKAGVEKILVVLPPDAKELAALTQKTGGEAALLEEQTPDMRATIEHGLTWIEQHWQPDPTDRWFLSPADHPTLSPPVIQHLLTAWKDQETASIIIPTYQGKRGHPALIGWNHAPDIRAIPTGQGLNFYFREQRAKTLVAPVSSEEILHDLDTPEDYQELLRRWPLVRA